jgi:hypothetical protein
MHRVALALALTVPTTASAAVVWTGDFETNDLSQYNYILNGEVGGTPYITIVQDPVAQPSYAARIELHNDAVWGNGLKRVELQHSPAAGRTGEGATTYFAWSFYLPETLPEDPDQTIGYWESNGSFSQTMAFHVAGEELEFITQHPDYQVHWQADGMATAGEWHRIGMRVLWSTDPGVGEVDVWFDGDLVVDAAPAQTLPDGNSTFVQFGLLRGAFEFDDVPVIVIDHALEGDSPEDVQIDFVPGGGGGSDSGDSTGGGGGDDDTAGDTAAGDGFMPTTGGQASDDGGAPTSNTAGDGDDGPSAATDAGTDGSGGTESGAGSDDESSGCGCRSEGRAPAWSWLALAGLALVRRRARAVTRRRRSEIR